MGELRVLGGDSGAAGVYAAAAEGVALDCREAMVEWVWRAAVDSDQMSEVVVATDSEEVAGVCRERGMTVVMTSPECASGSDRVHEVRARWLRIFMSISKGMNRC